jgi:hypothetical protein
MGSRMVFAGVSSAALVLLGFALVGDAVGARSSTKYPSSIPVLGHSGATGWNSDPERRYSDATQNSWATGTNPAVNSIYLRIWRETRASRATATTLRRADPM